MIAYQDSQQYFYPQDDRLTEPVRYILPNFLTYVARRLYYNEFELDPHKSMSRIMIGRGVGETDSKIAIERFQKMIGVLPYTIYTIDDINITELRNYPMVNGFLYLNDIQRRVVFWQERLSLTFYSFFNNNRDYLYAKSLIINEIPDLSQLLVPVPLINVLNTLFKREKPIYLMLPVMVSFSEISKGEYAYEFEKWLSRHRLFDLSFKVELTYLNFIFSTEGKILPVKSFITEGEGFYREITLTRVEREDLNKVDVQIEDVQSIKEYQLPFDIDQLEVRFPVNITLNQNNIELSIYPRVNINWEVVPDINAINIVFENNLDRNRQYLIKFLISNREFLLYINSK